MSQPTTRQELIDYCLRRLGAPVLEINVAKEQIEDLVDDALQYFQERHFDGVYQTFLKYQITQDDIDRGTASGAGDVGITTSTVSHNVGVSTTFDYYENSNYIKVPDHIIGIVKIYKFEGSNSISTGMFSVKYQLFLNDIYYWGSTQLLNYAMTKSYLEDIDWLLTTEKQIRFNKRQNRLYLDVDWDSMRVGDYLVIDCYRMMDPTDYSKVWNDSFLKPYLTALIKRQWGINLSAKYRGMKLPGGIEYNGRELLEDAQREIDAIMEKMSSTYELPPLDMIG
jgi:hypothetical protein